MTSWGDVAAEAPELAARVRERFEATKHKTMATLRRDGSPRISGTETEFRGEGGAVELTVGSMPGALKALDLLRDPRVSLHSATVDPPEGDESGWVGEAKVAGVAVPIDPTPEQPDAHFFRIDLTEVVLTGLSEDGKALAIESWHPGRGYQRRIRA